MELSREKKKRKARTVAERKASTVVVLCHSGSDTRIIIGGREKRRAETIINGMRKQNKTEKTEHASRGGGRDNQRDGKINKKKKREQKTKHMLNEVLQQSTRISNEMKNKKTEETTLSKHKYCCMYSQSTGQLAHVPPSGDACVGKDKVQPQEKDDSPVPYVPVHDAVQERERGRRE